MPGPPQLSAYWYSAGLTPILGPRWGIWFHIDKRLIFNIFHLITRLLRRSSLCVSEEKQKIVLGNLHLVFWPLSVDCWHRWTFPLLKNFVHCLGFSRTEIRVNLSMENKTNIHWMENPLRKIFKIAHWILLLFYSMHEEIRQISGFCIIFIMQEMISVSIILPNANI